MKMCTKCSDNKERDDFYVRPSYKDGYSAWCIQCTLEYGKSYKASHFEDKRVKQREWRKRTNYCEKYLSNINNKLAHALRNRVGDIVRGRIKIGSAVKDLGCSVEELKKYLESKFQPGMTWENWSLQGWHIDHIKPLSSFDLTDVEQFKQACHYTNLQPLWAKENLVKYNKENL